MTAASRVVLGALLAGAITLAFAADPAVAAEPDQPVVVSGSPYSLKAKDGGGHTLDLTVTNLTSKPVRLVMTATSDDNCTPTLGPDEVPTATVQKVTVTLDPTCDLTNDEIALVLTTEASPPGSQIPIPATLAAETPAPYDALWGYLGAAVFAFALTLVLYLSWWSDDVVPRNIGAPLPGIAADWSFKDSIATNVGLAGSIFTGVLGASDVLGKIFPDDGDSIVVLAVVSAALTAGLIGAAPLILTLLRGGEKNKYNTVGGVLLASAIVLAATIGQVIVMAWVVGQGEIVSDWVILALTVGAFAILVLYFVRSTLITLTAGLEPPAEKKNETREAALLVRDAIIAAAHTGSATEAALMLESAALGYPLFGTSTGDGPPQVAAMP
jgi:hypothetical protein